MLVCLTQRTNGWIGGSQLIHAFRSIKRRALLLVGWLFLKLDFALTFGCRHLPNQEIILVGRSDPIFST